MNVAPAQALIALRYAYHHETFGYAVDSCLRESSTYGLRWQSSNTGTCEIYDASELHKRGKVASEIATAIMENRRQGKY